MDKETFLSKLLLAFAKWLSMFSELRVFLYARWTFVETCSFLSLGSSS